MKANHIFLALLAVVLSATSYAQYNSVAGQNRVVKREIQQVQVLDEAGEQVLDDFGNEVYEEVEVEVPVASDTYGNAAGSEYDLATDGAFEGNTIAVLHLYTGEGFDFSLPKAALAEKGFSVFRWINSPPPAEELREKLKDACQLWVISDQHQKLTDEHAEVIKEFFDSGKGLYIWGDNQPYYADANFLAQKIFNTTMNGNTYAAQTVGISGEGNARTGIVDGHLIATGVANMYEGITIATVEPTQDLNPLVYGSADNLVAAVYEKDGKRAIIDGGFTRLYYAWETAGTDRYVKNAAAWLVNYERFGEMVYDEDEAMKKKEEIEEIKKNQKEDKSEVIQIKAEKGDLNDEVIDFEQMNISRNLISQEEMIFINQVNNGINIEEVQED